MTTPAVSDRRPGASWNWWAIAGLAAIAILALALYTWSLSRNGMANSYYAAAVKSATLSWKAFLFGSLDPGSFVTVDKPPASLWVMALSGRLFGFSSWSMLLPQALAGVGSVLLLHRIVRSWQGEAAGLLAALAFALTPVSVLIFRYNNPDALLTFLFLVAAWAAWSALQSGSHWKLGLAGWALGAAFLTKMLMALLVVPAVALLYLVCGPGRLGRRVAGSMLALAAALVSGGWWLALVELWPDGSRPHVGGSQGDSWIDLVLSRSAGVLDSGATGANLSGAPGWWRLFNDQLAGQVSWLLPAALAGVVIGLIVTRGEPRTGMRRAGYGLWSMWLLVTAAVLSGATGTLHSYYTVALAPAVAALAAAAFIESWRMGRRDRRLSWVLPVLVGGTAVWAAVILSRVSSYPSALGLVVMAVGLAAAFALLAAPALRWPRGRRSHRAVLAAMAGLAAIAIFAGPAIYSAGTIGRSVTGSTAAAGPAASSRLATGTEEVSGAESGESLVSYLESERAGARFLVAVQGTSASVPLIISTGEPVVTIGGYKGRDPVPTVSELKALVASGDLRHVLLTSSSGSTSASSSGAVGTAGSAALVLKEVAEWVVAEGAVVPPEDYGGTSEGTLYYLGP